MAITSKCKFVAVDIGTFGSTNGACIFTHLNMSKILYRGQSLPGISVPSLPYVLIAADGAFNMSENLFKPRED